MKFMKNLIESLGSAFGTNDKPYKNEISKIEKEIANFNYYRSSNDKINMRGDLIKIAKDVRTATDCARKELEPICE